MKRIGAFILAFILSALSIFIYFPSFSFAADDVTVIPLVEGHFGLSEADAQSKVSAHKDIYFDNNTRAFAYTPGTSYNWTLCDSNGAVTSTHLSDKQVVALLCSSNRMDHNRTLISSFISNNNIFRGFMSGVGSIFTGDSDNGTKLLDIVTGNYNYLDSLNYDEDSQTITMSNDNGSVDKLREEIKKYYYDSIGLNIIEPSGTVKSLVDSPDFRSLFEYEEDYLNAYGVCDYKYAIYLANNMSFFINNEFNDYYYLGNSSSDNQYWGFYEAYRLYSYNNNSSHFFELSSSDKVSVFYPYSWYSNENFNSSISTPIWLVSGRFGYEIDYIGGMHKGIGSYVDQLTYFYSADGSPFKYFKSYSSLYNYINGDQTAYLSSQINQTGKDISFSINDMNENLGSKMDELIDSINSGKASMSQDELQNAIDKGLEDLNKNTEEIKDNTAEMNNKLDELIAAVNQGNDTLLEILGVTEYIAYSTTKDDGTAYTFDDLSFTFGSIYDALGNAILYGVNTLDADAASASYSSSAYSLSPVALLSDDDSGNSASGGSFSNSSYDSSYVLSSSGTELCRLSGRSFYKTNDGEAFVAYYYRPSGYSGPLLVSKDAASVSYTTEGRTFDYYTTISYAGSTWYVSNDEYSMSGNCVSTSGFCKKISETALSLEDAALLLLKTAGVKDSVVDSGSGNSGSGNSGSGNSGSGNSGSGGHIDFEYRNGLFGHFPFSVPYQLYEWLQVLKATPKCPSFTYNYGFLIGHKDEEAYSITFDLSAYQDWADNCKSFLRLSFTLFFAVGVFKKLKGVM